MWPGPCRNMCPTHRSLLCLILWIRLRLHVAGLASAGMLLPVNLDNIRLFAPLMSARVCLLRVHVSQPNVSKEQTDASYRRNFRRSPILSESSMLRSCPHLFIALAILDFTSMAWSARTLNWVPRYLKLNTFSSGSPSHRTFGRSCCCLRYLFTWTSRSATLPLKHCSFLGLCALVWCIFTPFCDLQNFDVRSAPKLSYDHDGFTYPISKNR